MTNHQAGTPDAASCIRVIKKYPNRRLYDASASSYVTLVEIKQLVMQGEPFSVIDVKTGQNLTRSILLQIILEEETAGIPLFSEQILAHIIRFYGHAMQGFVGAHLEKNMQALIDVQQQLSTSTPSMNAEAWSQLMSIGNPLMPNALSTYLEKSQTTLNQMQEQMLSVMGLKR